MHIINLTEDQKNLYFVCLEDWSESMQAVIDMKAAWYEEMAPLGLRVKLALADDGSVGGMIEYMPVEYAFVEGAGCDFVNCIWVHGYDDKSRRNYQGHGMGQALLKAAEQDTCERGKHALIAWGIAAEFWMSASWYEKQGYVEVDRLGGSVLVWKPFTTDAVRPRWIRSDYELERVPGKVVVTSFINGQCPSANSVHTSAKRAAQELGDQVIFRVVNTFDKDTMRKYGRQTGLYIDGVDVADGIPPTYEQLKALMEERLQ